MVFQPHAPMVPHGLKSKALMILFSLQSFWDTWKGAAGDLADSAHDHFIPGRERGLRLQDCGFGVLSCRHVGLANLAINDFLHGSNLPRSQSQPARTAASG